MRPVMLAMLGLMLAATPVLAARQAGPVDSARDGSRAAAPAKHGSAAGGVKSGGHQAGRSGHGRVQTASHGRRAAVRTRFGWTHGLAPAAKVQASECPDGTLSTLAQGHDDVVRCMPI